MVKFRTIIVLITVLGFSGAAGASLTVIGSTSLGAPIVFDSGQGLIWLDSTIEEGDKSWSIQNDFVNALNPSITSSGYSISWTGGWRMPTVAEMGSLYTSMGLTPGQVGDKTTYPFVNSMGSGYWSSEVVETQARVFSFYTGGNDYLAGMNEPYYALAVRDGIASPVPIPAAAWLLGSGMVGFVALRRKLR